MEKAGSSKILLNGFRADVKYVTYTTSNCHILSRPYVTASTGTNTEIH